VKLETLAKPLPRQRGYAGRRDTRHDTPAIQNANRAGLDSALAEAWHPALYKNSETGLAVSYRGLRNCPLDIYATLEHDLCQEFPRNEQHPEASVNKGVENRETTRWPGSGNLIRSSPHRNRFVVIASTAALS
jgi:hypothetical protein